MTTVSVKRGDVGRTFTDTLTSGGAPVDLTTATEVLFLLSHLERALVKELAATIVDADAGDVSYTTVATDLDIAGAYKQEWQVTFGDGQIHTFPDEGYNYVIVDMDLGPADEADTQGTATTGTTCTPWATIADLDQADDALNPTVITDCLQMATDVLFNLTGRRWPGVCTDVVRPHGWCHCGPGTRGRRDAIPTAWNRGSCTCARPSSLRLPQGPVVGDVTVSIDGVALVQDVDFRVDNARWLVRLDDDAWPCCQDLAADPSTDDDTFEITYSYGALPPVGGRRAAAILAGEFALSRANDDPTRARCRLPKRVQTITRQGTTMVVLDPLDLLDKGRTGIPEVDLWVSSVMAGDKRRRASVMVPGRARSFHR